MLKITTIETEAQRRLILDGGIVGPWAAELDKAWQTACDSLGARKLLVDLTGVTVISQDGTQILSNMKSHGAEFVCRGVYVKHVLRNLATLCKIRQARRRAALVGSESGIQGDCDDLGFDRGTRDSCLSMHF